MPTSDLQRVAVQGGIATPAPPHGHSPACAGLLAAPASCSAASLPASLFAGLLADPNSPTAAAHGCCRCGDIIFDGGDNPVDLPRLVSLEIDECYFPPDGFPLALCLTHLTSLRLVGGRCTRLPPGISQLQSLQVRVGRGAGWRGLPAAGPGLQLGDAWMPASAPVSAPVSSVSRRRHPHCCCQTLPHHRSPARHASHKSDCWSSPSCRRCWPSTRARCPPSRPASAASPR